MKYYIQTIIILFLTVINFYAFAIPDNSSFYKNVDDITHELFPPRTYKPKIFLSPYVNDGEFVKIKIAYDIIDPFDGSTPEYAIVVLPGKGESFIRYSELIYDLQNLTGNKIRFYLMDEAGQGFSGRFETDTKNGVYVDCFLRYEQDLLYFVQNIVKAKKDGTIEVGNNKTIPVFLLAHSMGGAIAVKFLENNYRYFSGAILSSPMLKPKLKIKTKEEIYKLALEEALDITRWQCLVEGYGKRYAWGQHDRTGTVDRSDVSHSVHRSNEWEEHILGKDGAAYFHECQKKYNLAIGGATWNWLKEALKTSKSILMEENIKKIEIPILLLTAIEDNIVSVESEELFSTMCNKGICTIKRIQGRHELLMEIDSIRGDGTKNEDENTVISHIIRFLKKHRQVLKHWL